jgi:hypothetical protein
VGGSSGTADRDLGPAAAEGGVDGEPGACGGLSSPACTSANRIVSTLEPRARMSERIPRRMEPTALTSAAKTTPTSVAGIAGSIVNKYYS